MIYLKFEIGEKVKIKTFKKGSWPHWWVFEMRDWAGKNVIIKSIKKTTSLPYNIHGSHWGWRASDFEKISHLPDKLFEI